MGTFQFFFFEILWNFFQKLFFSEHVAAPVCTCWASCVAEVVGAAHRRAPEPALARDHEAVWPMPVPCFGGVQTPAEMIDGIGTVQDQSKKILWVV